MRDNFVIPVISNTVKDKLFMKINKLIKICLAEVLRHYKSLFFIF